MYRDGEREGYWVDYSEQGFVELSGTYLHGQADGMWVAWHANGRARGETQCRNGKFDGPCSFWDADGVLDTQRSGVYQQGELITPR